MQHEIPHILRACGNQRPQDRLDLVVKGFRAMILDLMKDIGTRDIFGRAIAVIQVEEWQVRYVVNWRTRALILCHVVVMFCTDARASSHSHSGDSEGRRQAGDCRGGRSGGQG
eukprot:GHVU01024888.1.p1 GENE.GHVU01024888.1~~GHVU01024888.1.p1  ORF type:complete len:113 (-),score=5.04 GHVU01024888.1:175-513(-)